MNQQNLFKKIYLKKPVFYVCHSWYKRTFCLGLSDPHVHFGEFISTALKQLLQVIIQFYTTFVFTHKINFCRIFIVESFLKASA